MTCDIITNTHSAHPNNVNCYIMIWQLHKLSMRLGIKSYSQQAVKIRLPGTPSPWREILISNMETRFKHNETSWLSQFYLTGAIGTIISNFLGARSMSGQILWSVSKKIFSILDIYAHTFNSSGALQNKYYATKKWLESGLLYEESIEHIMEGYMESPKWR